MEAWRFNNNAVQQIIYSSVFNTVFIPGREILV